MKAVWPKVANYISLHANALRIGLVHVLKGQGRHEGMLSMKGQALIRVEIYLMLISNRRFEGPAHLIHGHTVASFPRCALRDHEPIPSVVVV